MPIFYVYMHNKTDEKDDTVLKVVAPSSVAAKKMAGRRDRGRFTIGSAYRPKDFKIKHPDWYELLYKQSAETTLDG